MPVRRLTLVAPLLGLLIAPSGAASAASQPPPAPTAASPPAPTAASPAPVIPPDLQALEPKMLALQVNSERFSASLAVAGSPKIKGPIGGIEHIFGRTSSVSEALLSVSGEWSVAPAQASVRVSFLGLAFNMRLVGTTLYTEEPFVRRIDGGRPWIEKPGQTLAQVVGAQAPGVSATTPGPVTGFAGLVKTVNTARTIQELGAATVDGTPTTAFKVAVDLTRARKLSARQRRTFHRLLEPFATLELFLAANGLPVRERTLLRVRHGQGELIAQSDTLAVNIPVSVQAPPARETIGEAALNRLLAPKLAHRRHTHARSRTHRGARKK
jgi:hypothetical protein